MISHPTILYIALCFLILSCSSPQATEDGEIIETYPNGNVCSKYTIKEGKLEGIKYDYYEDGTLKCTETWLDNSRQGKAAYYYPNGDLELEGEYLNGEKMGCWREYYSGHRIKSFKDFLRSDSTEADIKSYPNRYLYFLESGDVDTIVLSMYHELNIQDTLGERFAILRVVYVPANTKIRVIYSHGSSSDLDTLGEQDNPVLFKYQSASDYVFGTIQCYTDTFTVDGKWQYNTYDSYFDSRKPTCKVREGM